MRQIEAHVVTIEAADSRGHSALVGMQSLTRHIRRKLSLIVQCKGRTITRHLDVICR
jgi:hypothetical protein